MNWQPNSWRRFPILQVPEYPDQGALNKVEQKLAENRLLFLQERYKICAAAWTCGKWTGIFASGRRLCREFC